MAVMRTERLIASDGTIQEERKFDGFGKLVSKRKNIRKEKEKMTVNIPPTEEPLGVPGFHGYGELRFHQGIGHITLSQMIQRELDRLEQAGDMLLTLKEVYDDYFIYFSSGDNKLFKRDYSVKDGRVEISDKIQEVTERTEYEEITNRRQGQEWEEEPLLPLGFDKSILK